MSELVRLEYDALTRQLERMRAMQYAYNRKFFTLLFISSVGVLWGLRDGSVLFLAAVPFGLVTTGVTASFFLHCCDFARVHARALEGRINQILGGRVLIASELEAEYFYPHATPKLSGLTWGKRWTLFNWFTLHFCAVWVGVSAVALTGLWRMLPDLQAAGLTGTLLFWAGGNVAVLDRWFGNAAAERRMQEQLSEVYGGSSGDVHSR